VRLLGPDVPIVPIRSDTPCQNRGLVFGRPSGTRPGLRGCRRQSAICSHVLSGVFKLCVQIWYRYLLYSRARGQITPVSHFESAK